MRKPILVIKNISKTFPGVKALQNVNLDLYPSEVHALVGENGAGKSTLMNIISGILKYDEGGSMIYENVDYEPNSPSYATEKGIIIIHQELNLIRDMSIQENIFLGSEIASKSRILLRQNKMKKISENVIKMVGLNKSPSTKIRDLSVGEQQMVEIAKALSKNAKILIFDEPTAALTDSEVDRLFELIEKLKNEGVAMFYISHKMDEIFRISDRITVLRDGHTITTNKAADTDVSTIISEMVGRELHEVFPKRNHSVNDEIVLEVQDISDMEGMVNNVSFSLYRGEILGISGLMGSGRSELTKLLFGARKKKSGKLFLHGKNCVLNSPIDAVKKNIYLVTEDRKTEGLIIDNTVTENILLPNLPLISSLKGLNKKQGEKLSENIIEQLAIKTPSGDIIVNNLSGGNQQKTYIGKWLVSKPEILILDEPTRGVDVGAKAEIYRIINSLSQEGISIIMVSSELPEILGLTDRVIVLHEGTVCGEFNTSETNQSEIMFAATGEKNGNK